jgi:hypothetical protein
MRAGAIAAIAFCVASSVAVAADGPAGGAAVGPVPDGLHTSPYLARIEPLIVYDYQPGVIVRSYWLPPFENRHYFPKTGKRPKVGRHEHKTSGRDATAQDYFRAWGVSSVFAPQLPPPLAVLPEAIEPAPSLGHPK